MNVKNTVPLQLFDAIKIHRPLIWAKDTRKAQATEGLVTKSNQVY